MYHYRGPVSQEPFRNRIAEYGLADSEVCPFPVCIRGGKG